MLVSASSCLGMSLAMFAILDPGDEVIVFSPYFALYRAQIELAGGVCVDVPTYAEEDYAISEERLRAAITPRTKAIISITHRTHRHGLRFVHNGDACPRGKGI